MSAIIPFSPAQGSNKTSTVGAGGTATYTVGRSNNSVRILNIGTGVLHVRFSSASAPVVATNADFAVGPNASSVLSKSHAFDQISVFSPAGADVHVISGEGF